MDVDAPPPPKQARAIATRAKLLEAAAKTLSERGYAGTSTTEVCGRAGVSQGALYKHFGSKHRLIAATTEHLFTDLVARFRAAFEAGQAEGADRVGVALRELWSVFIRPELYAVMELYIAARTDAALRDALAPVLAEHRQNLVRMARGLFPEAARDNPRFDSAVDGIITTMQGAAMSAAVLEEALGRDVLVFLDPIARRELEPPYGAHP